MIIKVLNKLDIKLRCKKDQRDQNIANRLIKYEFHKLNIIYR